MVTRCHDPFILTPEKHSHGDIYIPVGCGNCPYCVNRRVNEWSFRLMQEHKQCDTAYFVTLTYDPMSIPYSPRGYKTLEKNDLKRFFKRLRYYHSDKRIYTNMRDLGIYQKKPIKYYACGEYGTQTKRPHYHAIIFNAHHKDIERSWDVVKNQDGQEVRAGDIHIGQVTLASCRYVMKYMAKKTDKPYPYPWDGQKQFSFKSNGLGKDYLTKEMIKWHRASYSRNYCVYLGGYKCSMPRYYRDKIWTTKDEQLELMYHISDAMDEEYYKQKKIAESKGKSYIDLINSMKRIDVTKLNYQLKNRSHV